jgi:tRNA dimethylallyltransferase
VIAGPTAVGKTDVAIAVARHFSASILSADSRQFYRQLSIGTAKPDEGQLRAAEHHFINNKDIGELYGAGHYERDATAMLKTLFEKHDVVLLAGGSGLYIQAVLEGVDDLPEAVPGLRKELTERFRELGIGWLKEELRKRDESYFRTADTSNPQRLLRALEVCMTTGIPYSAHLKRNNAARDFTPVKILLHLDRKVLYERINERADRMMRQGLLEEARKWQDYRHCNALNTVGYRELYDYLDGKYDLETAVEKIKQHTRNYAKRQLTWFRNQDDFTELPPDPAAVISYIESVIHG